jgi:hypothetical protein
MELINVISNEGFTVAGDQSRIVLVYVIMYCLVYNVSTSKL